MLVEKDGKSKEGKEEIVEKKNANMCLESSSPRAMCISVVVWSDN
jgi:hypothetical protein